MTTNERTTRWPFWSLFSWGALIVCPLMVGLYGRPNYVMAVWYGLHGSVVLLAIYVRFR